MLYLALVALIGLLLVVRESRPSLIKHNKYDFEGCKSKHIKDK